MRPLYTLATLLATASSPVRAHWVYNQLIVNDAFIGEPYQYIRQPQNGNNFLSDVNSTDMRCNIGGASGLLPTNTTTDTATVRAGDQLGFGIDSTFGHPGIQQVYLSPAPPPSNNNNISTLSSYDGSGGWARIYALTTTPTYPNGTGSAGGKHSFPDAQPGSVDWAPHKLTNFTFPLPRETPAGEYLLRAEGVALHAAHKLGGAQFYVACAQIRVVGTDEGIGGRGREIGPLVRIPGVYRADEPGVLIPTFWSALTRYVAPGPKLWPPGTEEQHVAEYL